MAGRELMVFRLERIGVKPRSGRCLLYTSPGDPGGRPLIAGNPDPAERVGAHPAAVMIGEPAEGLFGEPCPPAVSYTHLDVYKRQA